MSNNSTPRSQVATVRSLTLAQFRPGYKPTPVELRDAVERVVDYSYRKKNPITFHRDGRAFVPYQRMTSPQKKIGKGNGKRV